MTDFSQTLEYKLGEVLGIQFAKTCQEISPLIEAYTSELRAWKDRAEKFERQVAFQKQTIDFLNATLNEDAAKMKQVLDFARDNYDLD